MRLSSWQLPMEHLSATSVADFVSCPEQWRQKRLLKRPDKMFIARFIGAVHHRTIEGNLRQKIKTGTDISLEDIRELYDVMWHDVMAKDGEPEWLETPSAVGKQGLQMLSAFHRDVSPVIHPIAVEERFETTVPGVPVPIVGYPDVIQDNSIVEFKTAGQKVSKPKPKWRFQARIYQLVYPRPVEWVVTTKQVTPVNYTSANAPDLWMEAGNNDVTALQVAQAAEQMNDLYARYGPDRPWPMNGLFGDWTCAYCFAGPKNPNPTCPAWKDQSDETAT